MPPCNAARDRWLQVEQRSKRCDNTLKNEHVHNHGSAPLQRRVKRPKSFVRPDAALEGPLFHGAGDVSCPLRRRIPVAENHHSWLNPASPGPGSHTRLFSSPLTY